MVVAMTYPSKVFAAYGIMEWGLSDVRVTSPSSFTATSKGEVVKFVCTICSHINFEVSIPQLTKSKSEFLLMLIDNKVGDNFIVLCASDVHHNKTMTFEEMAPLIKRKARFEINKTNE
jgi:hypothetical protein